jgi:hypothetical protein
VWLCWLFDGDWLVAEVRGRAGRGAAGLGHRGHSFRKPKKEKPPLPCTASEQTKSSKFLSKEERAEVVRALGGAIRGGGGDDFSGGEESGGVYFAFAFGVVGTGFGSGEGCIVEGIAGASLGSGLVGEMIRWKTGVSSSDESEVEDSDESVDESEEEEAGSDSDASVPFAPLLP